MSKIEIVQCGFLLPTINHLIREQVNIEPHLKNSRLSNFEILNKESYIPYNLIGDFYQFMCKEIGKKEFIQIILNSQKLPEISSYGQMLANSSTLLECLLLAAKFDKVIYSGESMDLLVEGSTARFSSILNREHYYANQFFEALNISAILSGFRFFLGKDWDPLAIHLQSSDHPIDELPLTNPGKVKILEKQESTSLVFHTNDLIKEVDLSDNNPDHILVENVESLERKISKLFHSFSGNNVPSMDQIADQFNLSPRTLRRRLANEGVQFETLLEQWRFSKSIEMLKKPDLSVKEMSEQLFYSNPSNFIRAFKSWTQTTPSQYRERLVV